MQRSHADSPSKAHASISRLGAKKSFPPQARNSVTHEVRFTALDLTEPDAAAKLAGNVEQLWGGLDVLVTNAGAASQGGFLELKDEDWVNLTAAQPSMLSTTLVDRDVLDTASGGWVYHQRGDRPSRYHGRTPETREPAAFRRHFYEHP